MRRKRLVNTWYVLLSMSCKTYETGRKELIPGVMVVHREMSELEERSNDQHRLAESLHRQNE